MAGFELSTEGFDHRPVAALRPQPDRHPPARSRRACSHWQTHTVVAALRQGDTGALAGRANRCGRGPSRGQAAGPRRPASENAAKTDFSDEYVHAICYLLDHMEERLLTGVDRGIIPHTFAMEIARAAGNPAHPRSAQSHGERPEPRGAPAATRHGRCDDSRIPEGNRPTKAPRQEGGDEPESAAIRHQCVAATARRRTLRDVAAGEGMQTLPRPLAERLGLATGA